MTNPNDLIRRGDALAELDRHAKGKIVLSGQTLRTIQLGEATSAIAAIPGAGTGVRFKPLVWEDFDRRGAKARAWRKANYLITYWKSYEAFELVESYPGYQGDAIGDGFYPTIEAAKASAQADYEAQILASIDLSPRPALEAAVRRALEAAAVKARSYCYFRTVEGRVLKSPAVFTTHTGQDLTDAILAIASDPEAVRKITEGEG